MAGAGMSLTSRQRTGPSRSTSCSAQTRRRTGTAGMCASQGWPAAWSIARSSAQPSAPMAATRTGLGDHDLGDVDLRPAGNFPLPVAFARAPYVVAELCQPVAARRQGGMRQDKDDTGTVAPTFLPVDDGCQFGPVLRNAAIRREADLPIAAGGQTQSPVLLDGLPAWC